MEINNILKNINIIYERKLLLKNIIKKFKCPFINANELHIMIYNDGKINNLFNDLYNYLTSQYKYKYKGHITLLTLVFNTDHPNYAEIKLDRNNILKAYNDHLVNKLIFYDNNNKYEFLGKDSKFLVKIFKPSNKYSIENFRDNIYNQIKNMVDYNISPDDSLDKKYKLFKSDDEYLFAVPVYDYNIDDFKPHMSIASIKNIKNEELKSKSYEEILNILKNKNLLPHINNITINNDNFFQLNISWTKKINDKLSQKTNNWYNFKKNKWLDGKQPKPYKKKYCL